MIAANGANRVRFEVVEASSAADLGFEELGVARAEAYKATDKAQDTAIKGDYALARQRTAFAAGGATVGTGTPVTVFGESAGRIAGDVEEQQYAGRIESQRWQDQAYLKELEAQNAKKAGNIAATGAIIGGLINFVLGLCIWVQWPGSSFWFMLPTEGPMRRP
jgi:ribosomal protein L27